MTGQDATTRLDRDVRLVVYRHFTDTGAAPSTADIAAQLDVAASQVDAALQRLADARTIVLAPGSTRIWMAHPFSAVQTAYPVVSGTRTWWANCAWDVLGIPTLLGVDTETTTACADCGERITVRVRHDRLEGDDAVVHFAVPARNFWDDIGFT